MNIKKYIEKKIIKYYSEGEEMFCMSPSFLEIASKLSPKYRRMVECFIKDVVVPDLLVDVAEEADDGFGCDTQCDYDTKRRNNFTKFASKYNPNELWNLLVKKFGINTAVAIFARNIYTQPEYFSNNAHQTFYHYISEASF